MRPTGACSTPSSSSPTDACSTDQLQSTIRQFEQTLGVVENIDTTSRQLKDALETGKTIIVTTLQKFPVIAAEIGELPGRRFALIIDEAHSSQSGESTKSLKAVLSLGLARSGGAGGGGRSDAGRRAGEHDSGRDGTAWAAAERLYLCLHRDAQAQDARAVRDSTGGRLIRPVPSVQHAAGNRRELHPGRAAELHHLPSLLAPVEDGRRRPTLRQAQGRLSATIVRGVAPARHSAEGAHHGGALMPTGCSIGSAAERRR